MFTIAESTPVFPPRPHPPQGAPHVLVIVLDDLGFAQLGCFGSDIDTPTIDGLAAGGLRYNRFHVTSLCSPTRACLLTGRNHHAVGMGFLTDLPTGFPGYSGRIPPSAATLARILRDVGYSTFAVGKWHLTPRWEESASGPFDRWPLGLGFERYYGFLGGDTNQWTPDLVADNGFVEPPRTPAEGYHLTEDLADRAIRFIQDQQQATPGRRFFCYFAPGAMHAPHQAPRAFIDAYRGRFDAGWEAWREATFARQLAAGVVPEGTRLSERPSWVPAWDELPADQRRLYARMMEVFAGFLTHTDAQIGRLLDFLRTAGLLDDTLVLLISDNGASAEGGPTGSLNEHRFTHDRLDDLADTLAHIDDLGGFRAYNHYPWGWAWAGNTPLRLWKRYAWLGGVRTPLIAHWPAGIPDVGGRHGARPVLSRRRPAAHRARRRGHRPPRRGRRRRPAADRRRQPAVHVRRSRGAEPAPDAVLRDGRLPLDRPRRLEGHDRPRRPAALGRARPGPRQPRLRHRPVVAVRPVLRLRRGRRRRRPASRAGDRARGPVVARGGRNQVLPLDDSLIGRAVAMEPSPNLPRHRSVFRPGGGGVAEDLLPPMAGGFELTAHLDVPAGDGSGACSGVVCALGDWNNGWALYVVDGRPAVAFSLFGALHRAVSSVVLAPGRRLVRLGYERASDRREGGGAVHLDVEGECVAELELPHDLPFRWQIGGAGLHIGVDRGFPVCDDYDPPFPFTGAIERVEIVIPQFAPRPDDAARSAADVAQALRHE